MCLLYTVYKNLLLSINFFRVVPYPASVEYGSYFSFSATTTKFGSTTFLTLVILVFDCLVTAAFVRPGEKNDNTLLVEFILQSW